MNSKREAKDVLRCTFCGKSQNEVKKLIAGPDARICDECVRICNEILADDPVAHARSDAQEEAEEGAATTTGSPSSSVEWVSCPACAAPLELSLTVKP